MRSIHSCYNPIHDRLMPNVPLSIRRLAAIFRLMTYRHIKGLEEKAPYSYPLSSTSPATSVVLQDTPASIKRQDRILSDYIKVIGCTTRMRVKIRSHIIWNISLISPKQITIYSPGSLGLEIVGWYHCQRSRRSEWCSPGQCRFRFSNTCPNMAVRDVDRTGIGRPPRDRPAEACSTRLFYVIYTTFMYSWLWKCLVHGWGKPCRMIIRMYILLNHPCRCTCCTTEIRQVGCMLPTINAWTMRTIHYVTFHRPMASMDIASCSGLLIW